jgi:outer membrane protein assembly factor BamB
MRLAWLPVLGFSALLSACNPILTGECTSDRGCPAGQACDLAVGLCLPLIVDAGTTGDGGATHDCSPECAVGLVCMNGSCETPGPTDVAILSPVAGGLYGAVDVSVTVHASAPEGITKLDVRLNNLQGTVLTVPAVPGAQPDEYLATVNLADPAVASGDFSLVAVMLHGVKRSVSPAITLKVDKDGPAIRVLGIPYPSRDPSSPAMNAFLRDEQIEIDASVTDAVAGISTQPPVLTMSGMSPVNGTPVSGHLFKFNFDARAPVLNAIQADLDFQIGATNTLGTVGSAKGTVRISRHKWVWTKVRPHPIHAAPVLAHGLVILGSDDGYVYALRPTDGSVAWEHHVNTAVVGHITAGQSNIYVAGSDGHVFGLNADDVMLPANKRQIFQCPSGSGGFGLPPLRSLGTGLTLGTTQISAQDPTQQETLFAFTSDGHIQMFRQSLFPNQFGPPQGCVRESGDLNTSNDASPPVLVQENGDIHLFFGDADGQVHSSSVTFQAPNSFSAATFTINNDWALDLGSPIHGQLAFGMFGPGSGLLAVREDTVPQAINVDNTLLWPPPAHSLPGQARKSPIVTSKTAYVLGDAGDLQALSLANGGVVGQPVSIGMPGSMNANAAPIATADQRVYVASGTRLAAMGPDGALEWTFEPSTPASGTAMDLDAVSPAFACNGMLYVVATNDNRGLVHAIITDSLTGLASGGWVRAFHDSHNTSNVNTPVSTGGQCAD